MSVLVFKSLNNRFNVFVRDYTIDLGFANFVEVLIKEKAGAFFLFNMDSMLRLVFKC